MRLPVLLVSVFVFAQSYIAVSDAIRHSDNEEIFTYTVEIKKMNAICKEEEAKYWSYKFHNCFVDRKVNDGGRDLNNIVDRILDHSKDCIKNSTKECRPDHEGFMVIMKDVISEMKDFCFMYLESIIHERNKVKDLDCVEKILLTETYKKCFKKEVLNKQTYTKSEDDFRKEVENAITCTNKANKECSKEAKTDLNRIVRNILHVRQPETENIEDDPPIPEPPMRWYDYIIQPFVSAWKTIKSWFGW